MFNMMRSHTCGWGLVSLAPLGRGLFEIIEEETPGFHVNIISSYDHLTDSPVRHIGHKLTCSLLIFLPLGSSFIVHSLVQLSVDEEDGSQV